MFILNVLLPFAFCLLNILYHSAVFERQAVVADLSVAIYAGYMILEVISGSILVHAVLKIKKFYAEKDIKD